MLEHIIIRGLYSHKHLPVQQGACCCIPEGPTELDSRFPLVSKYKCCKQAHLQS